MLAFKICQKPDCYISKLNILNDSNCVFLQKDMIPVHYAALNDKEEIVELFFNVKPDTMTQIDAVRFFSVRYVT